MIGKREILDAAARVSLIPHVVEKDYVLGWMFAEIGEWVYAESGNESLSSSRYRATSTYPRCRHPESSRQPES